MMLSERERERYARHLMLDGVGEAGQQKLKEARVLIVGVGGLGSPLALYLAAAGVGTLGLVDDDLVSESNLQRQVLYSSADVGQPKVQVARQRLLALNPHIAVQTHRCWLVAENVLELVGQYDIVVDGCDNLFTRYLMNDACVELGKVYVYGAIREYSGQVSVFNFKNGPTYRCLYPYTESVKTASQPQGVMGVLPAMVASLQGAEAIKVITGIGTPLSGELMLIDLLSSMFQKVTIARQEGWGNNLLV